MGQPHVGEGRGLVARLLRRLVGQAEDEIGRHARNARQRPLDRSPRAGRIVQPAEVLELLRSQRLRPDRDAPDAHVDQGLRPLAIEGRGVALDGHLHVARHLGARADAGQDPSELPRRP